MWMIFFFSSFVWMTFFYIPYNRIDPIRRYMKWEPSAAADRAVYYALPTWPKRGRGGYDRAAWHNTPRT